MLGFLYRFFIGSFFICKHNWKTTCIIDIVDENNYVIRHKYILKCEHCGDIKTKRS